ncbi:MAG: sigma-70 family RNA polymerase sigma factor [Candidatus Sungbacteria bacterium]|nr:sigma-70 family RNA polymerase sigma factor [Candidatus Sungbacteria bacterium]
MIKRVKLNRMDYREDQKLVADYLAGDKEALEILISRYLRSIYRFLYRYAGNVHDAEDLTQEVFVKIWRNLKRFDQDKGFKTWIFSIAKNTAIDFLKKSRSASGGKKTILFSEFSARGGSAFGGENEEGENVFLSILHDKAPLPDELAARKNIGKMLEDALNLLSPRYSVVFNMHYDNGLTFREIAESLQEPLHTVKSRYRRALALLKNLLSES